MDIKKIRFMAAACFALFLTGISAAGFLTEDREFSPNENRYLAEAPKLSWDGLLSGDYQEDLEEYLKDQIFCRDQWITVKTAIQKASGNTDIGGAYVGKDGYDFEKITPEDVDEKQVAQNTESLARFFSDTSQAIPEDRLYFLLVPTSGLVMADKLPKNARLFDQAAYMDQIQSSIGHCQVIDVREELSSHSNEYIYYRTDHHWTTDGAFWAYQKWCESVGMPYTAKERLGRNVVTEDFRGSLYSKILDAGSAYDSIWTYTPMENGLTLEQDFQVTVDGETPGLIYDTAKLKEKDQYAFFFGGNFGQVHIEKNAPQKDAKSLLVIKDSFANAFVPLALEQFDHIYMVDLRYYNGDIQGYLAEHEITDVLVLYNISNFISDKNLHKLQNRSATD